MKEPLKVCKDATEQMGEKGEHDQDGKAGGCGPAWTRESRRLPVSRVRRFQEQERVPGLGSWIGHPSS